MRKSLIIFSVLLICCLFVGFASAGYNSQTQIYEIYNKDDLIAFSAYVDQYGNEATNAKIMDSVTEIDMTTVTSWTPIGSSQHQYAGTFNGNGKRIKNLKITNAINSTYTVRGGGSADIIGNALFGIINGAVIENIWVDNFGFTFSDSTTKYHTGAVIALVAYGGYNIKNIQITSSSLSVSSSVLTSGTSANTYVGGILAISSSTTGKIKDCSVDCNFYASSNRWSYIGGIAGTTDTGVQIENCYSTAIISATSKSQSQGVRISNGVGVVDYGSMSVINSVSLSKSVIKNSLSTGTNNGLHRIIGYKSSSVTTSTISNNYALSTSYATYSWTPTSSETGTDGADIIPSQVNQAFFQNTLGWNFANTWYWDSTATWQDKDGVTYYGLPKLQVFNPSVTPSISAISVTSSSPAQVGSTVQVSATLSNINEAGTVQFATSTNGNTWTNVGEEVSIASGATSATQTFTGSSTAGLYYVKAILTVGSTTVDSHTSGVTDGQVRLVDTPTITTATITPSIGKLSTAYTPAITIPITGLGGAQTVYYKLQQLSGSTWSDISGKAGTATATGSKTLTVSINDASETTHSYRVLVSSLSDYTASVTATSNTVTFQTFAPPATPTAEINPATITINTATEVTLTASNVPTAPAGNTYYYQWFYGSSSTPSSGDTAITEQETTLTNPATWSATFTQTGTKYVYLKITDAAGNDPVYSPRQTLTISNYAPPTITMVSRQTSSPALTGSDVKVKVIATSYEGTTTHLTYKWYYAVSSASPEWTEISGQTTNILTTQFSTEGTYMLKCVVTDTSISMSTDSYTAGKYATVQIVPQPSISAVAVNPYVLDLSVSTTVQLSASVTNPSGVSSLVWQVQKDGGEWTNTPLTLDHGTVTVSSAGTYLYRLQVTPIVGSVITSENTHSVVAGTLPVISIVSPPNNSQYGVGETIQINATGTGVTAIQWSFGDGVKASGNTNTLTPWVQYTGIGIHTITLTAANSFGNKTASIQIIVSSAKRPLATSTPAPIKDANMVYEWMENFNPQSAEDQSPDVMGIFKGLTAPFTNVMGQWFYLALFGIPYLLIWIRTRNTIIPSIIGILFGAWLWVMLPGSAMAAAVCILILSVSGGIFGIYLSRRQRE